MLRADVGVDDAAVAADARIDDGDVDRFRRKPAGRFGQDDRPGANILCGTECETSTSFASGLIERMTPFIAAT